MNRPTPSPARHTLVLNVGNTSLFGGVFAGARPATVFRLALRDLARLPRRVRRRPDQAVVCSVVPALTPRVRRLLRRTWQLDAHVLTAASPHGLKIAYRQPRTLGPDRIAAALGARQLFPRRHVIVVDCGTATTVTALHRDGTLLGGAILPGVSLWADALAKRTALLPPVKVVDARVAIGRSPEEGIASGLYFGHLGALRELITRVRREAFGRAAVAVIGTGGHAPLFAAEDLFTRLEPALVLIGLNEFARRTAGDQPLP